MTKTRIAGLPQSHNGALYELPDLQDGQTEELLENGRLQLIQLGLMSGRIMSFSLSIYFVLSFID